MHSKRKRPGGGTVVLAVLTALVVLGTAITGATASSSSTASRGLARQWTERGLTGTVRLTGQVPLSVTNGVARSLGAHPANAPLTLNFSFPLRDQAALDRLIAKQAKTHRYLSRKQLYARFAPPQAQVSAVGRWLQSKGFRITHVGRDRMSIAARASTATVERALKVEVADFLRPATTFGALKVRPYRFYANTSAPALPARLGIQTISGLSDVSRFFTTYQLAHPAQANRPGTRDPFVRGGGYFPSDLRGLYDITGHGFDGTGQTVGMTLWTAPEKQTTLTSYANTTGDTPITIDPSCIASSNSPTTPSSCSTQTVGPDHLLQIMENGNVDPGTNFGSNVETALDIEAAHGMATHVGEKYYMSECHPAPDPGSGLANGSCNGTDVGMEEAMEDAANDPTLHAVSNSWGYGGEAEWGLADPFVLSTSNILALAAAAGTSFYFSTGDAGTYESGYPTDSPYVVSVGGTSTWSTGNTAQWSTSTTWSGAGSWCSNLFARPPWQVGAGVASVAECPGRISPDISAIADTSTSFFFRSSTLTGTQSGGVGGTSVAAPVLNGMQAVVNNLVDAQTYPGATPKIGFITPLLYQLGNSGNADSYYRDIECGNTANPTSGPDGEAAIRGFDAATGWGEPDEFNFAIGIAKQLGATNLSTPASLSRHFAWTCAKTPSNSAERAFSCPSASTCYAVGASSGGTPWYGKFLAAGAWGAVNTIFKSTNGGQSWFPSNSDMFSIACTSSSTCNEVGAGGRERRTTDGGNTWADVATAPGNNKPLTQVECPSSSTCYAVGDRGNAMKSTDGGQTWSWLSTTDGNPLYGLSCPTTQVCYATDIYAHVIKTTDGGSTWTWQVTPVTTPLSGQVAETGGPNPFAGLTGISCSDASTCAAVGFYATVSGQTPANGTTFVVTTTDGGQTWTRQLSNTGTSYLAAVNCLPGTTTCFAVGRGGAIATTTDLATWTPMVSNTTSMLNSVSCSSTSFCIAVGQNGTVDTYNGSAWTATTGNGGTGMLADVACDGNLVCYATGKQGITVLTTTGGTSWTQQAGGGSQASQLNGISCPTATTCYAVGNGGTAQAPAPGTILKTSNGGQTWQTQTSGTASNVNLSAVSCSNFQTCVTVGASGTARVATDGSTWNTGTTGTTQALNGVSCTTATTCIAVGAAGTALTSADGGSTWSAQTAGTTQALNAVSCPSAVCYAAGAAGTILRYDGASWSARTSGTTTALTGVSCQSDSACIAVGNSLILGTTNAGSSFAAQGNPLGGSPAAQNASGLALNAAYCTSSRCFAGAGAQGDILITVIAPSTSASLSPASPDGLNGWYVSAPTVTLTATAADKPVASTTYSIDGGPNQTYAGPFQVTTDGAHTISFFSTDTDGNAESSKSIQVKVDLHNPTSSAQITPAIQNGWYASPTVTLTGNDGSGSGIDHITYSIDGGASQTYSGPLSGFTTGNHFVQFRATDVAGRIEGTTNLIAFKADAKKPTVNVSTPPVGADYQLNKAVNAKFKCTDRESGIASCVGSTANGSPLDTSTVGTHTLTVTGTDKAGNVTVVMRSYHVHYAWKGFITRVTNTSSGSLNLVHAGDLIQLKFGLGGNQGLSVLDGEPSSAPISCPAWPPHSVPAAPAGSSSGLSYNPPNSQYRFGWQTAASWAGTCRRFTLSLNDGSAPHTADFQFFA